MRRSKKTSKLRVTGLCEGNPRWPVDFTHKGPVKRKMFPFDDVIMETKSVPWLVISRLFSTPGHQQPCYQWRPNPKQSKTIASYDSRVFLSIPWTAKYEISQLKSARPAVEEVDGGGGGGRRDRTDTEFTVTRSWTIEIYGHQVMNHRNLQSKSDGVIASNPQC